MGLSLTNTNAEVMIPEVIPPVSKQMRALLKSLTDEIAKATQTAGELILKINEQGKREKLSKVTIRSLIAMAIGEALSERQIRRLLPEELKYAEKVRDQSSGSKKPLTVALESEFEFADTMTANREEIKPQDFNVNDLWKYSAELKDEIIIFLDSEVKRLKDELRSA